MWVLRGPREAIPGIRRPRIITPRAPDHYPPDVRKRVTWVGQPTRCRRSIPATRRSLDRTIRGVRVRSPGGNAARIDLRGGVRLHRVPNGLRRGSDRCPHRAVRGDRLAIFVYRSTCPGWAAGIAGPCAVGVTRVVPPFETISRRAPLGRNTLDRRRHHGHLGDRRRCPMRVITPSAYPTEPKPNQETAVVTESSHRAPLGRPSHGQRCCQARLPMFE